MATGVELTDSDRVTGIALNFPANDDTTTLSSHPRDLPRRLRRRFLESKSPSTVEEIEAKLKEADLRRQQFYELLSSKARPKQRNPSCSSSQEEVLGQRLEAKLYAAEQKRLSILAKAQMRLARLDEQRQAAKTRLEMRFEKERDELGMKLESRAQQAEENRTLLLRAYRQRRMAKKERAAQSLMQRMIQESKYKECVHAAIHQKREAAEKKRIGLLEAEKTRAHVRVLQARRVVKSYSQREIERRKMKDQLEDRLQRAKRQSVEFSRQRGSLRRTVHVNSQGMHEHREFLARKIARCWRRFARLRRTTSALAKTYEALEINEDSTKSMPFEQLAIQIESSATIKNVEALLDRFESRFTLSRAFSGTYSLPRLDNIDHLLKHVASSNRRGHTSGATRSRGVKNVRPSSKAAQGSVRLSRYPVRIALCAYMILGHPNAVFSGVGEHESTLTESAANFIREFELIIKIILGGPIQTSDEETVSSMPSQLTFRSQLEAFDKAWCSYLYHFVVWKVKDARLLEDDLVRAACQLELSMMQTCKLTPKGDNGDVTHGTKAIQKQVVEDQKLLREKVQHLSGNAGIERMESALSNMRSRFFEAKETGTLSSSPSPSPSPIAHISSLSLPGSAVSSSVSASGEISSMAEAFERSSLVSSLFKKKVSANNEVSSSNPFRSIAEGNLGFGAMLVTENEVLVNEIVHEHHHGFADRLDASFNDGNSRKEKVRETMEKAFWDAIVESIKQDEPDYSWVLKLMKEVRDELCEISPLSWRQDIAKTIDIDILSQVLSSGTVDIEDLGKILEFALVTLHKLSAPANDDELKTTHHMLLKELEDISQAEDKSNASFALLMIKGLRFVLQQIQTLKREISRARIRIMEPLIKGPAGLEYLRKAFQDKYGSLTEAPTALPLTIQWLLSVRADAEQEWDEYMDSLSALTTNNARSSVGLPPTTLRTGGGVPMASKIGFPISTTTGIEQPECKGERVDLLVRLGLLKLVSKDGGLTQESLPETLKLNLSRLRAVQSQLQKIIVISTSILVLGQILLNENLVTKPIGMENMVSNCVKQLSELLDSVEDVGLAEIIETINRSSEGGDLVVNPDKFQARKEIMANMLAKSLQAGDPVFTRVSRAVYLAMRGVVLSGSGVKGRHLVETTLLRVGAGLLTEKVVEAAEMLLVVATVSSRVHGAWYEGVLKNL
ncbi:hypothetical protein L1049_026854 [Liquidambar formosana]|uniref:T-complex protein 11 n=1 Tax=Liquidambar formosana TaxID=63359 RepID=A0AAP0NHT5_LIQFO